MIWIFFPSGKGNPVPPQNIKDWAREWIFYTLDLLCIPLLYELIFSLKRSVRKLTTEEIEQVRSILGDTIPYDLVLIDTNSKFGMRKDVLAYVSFFMINCHTKLSMPIFMHEMVHIWQYHQFGSVYIAKALKAQRSEEGYNYGGSYVLYQAMVQGKNITHFNFEQQAEIIEDYYRKMKEKKISPMEENVYRYYADAIQKSQQVHSQA